LFFLKVCFIVAPEAVSVALPHGKSSFVRFKLLFSSDSEPVSSPRPQRHSSALEQQRNMAYVKEKEEDVS
jgi:hypothetical protein